MGKLKKGDVPLSFPLSKLSEIAPHILQACNFPKVLAIHDLIAHLETAVVQWRRAGCGAGPGPS